MGQTDEKGETAFAKDQSCDNVVKKQDLTGPNKYSIFFGHGVAGKKKQRFTVAIVPVSDTEVKVGVAICSPIDVFVKRIGRMIAEGRATKNPNYAYSGVNTTTIEGMLDIKKMVKAGIEEDLSKAKEIISGGSGITKQ